MYEEFFEVRGKIRLPTDIHDLIKINEIYSKGINEYSGSDEVKKLLNWDSELMNCHANSMIIHGYKGERLTALIEFTNGEQWPDLKKFENERLSFYSECINQTSNLSMKIRYLDYLVDYSDEKYKYAIQLVDELIKISALTGSKHKVLIGIKHPNNTITLAELDISKEQPIKLDKKVKEVGLNVV